MFRTLNLLTWLAIAAAMAAASPAHAAETAPSCTAAAGPGLSEHVIRFGGQHRDFTLYLPRRPADGDPPPMILDLHASGITPAIQLQITGMEQAAELQGFAVVLPQAVMPWPRGGFAWNVPRRDAGPDDVAFVVELLDVLQRRFCIDTRKVYAAGYSGGARLASQLACAIPGRIAAISAVAGLRHPLSDEGGCDARVPPVPVLAFHSVDDPVNPYRPGMDGHPPYWTYGIDEALARWISHNGCSSDPFHDAIAENIVRLRYVDCRQGATVELYRLSGSGHTWPGSRFRFPDFVGPTEPRVDATALTVAFFAHLAERAAGG